MDRLISEQAVIDAVSEWLYDKTRKESIETVIKTIPSAEPKIVPIAEIKFDDDMLHEIVEEAVKNIEIEPKWIPVSERLPEDVEFMKNNGFFIVSDGNRTYAEYFDVYCSRRFGEPTMSGFRVDYAVTAWMPLPKPYEPQENCDTCKHKDDGWDSEHCDGCCGNHSGFELQERSIKQDI